MMKCNPFTNTYVLMFLYGSHWVRNVQARIRNVLFEMVITVFFLLFLSRKNNGENLFKIRFYKKMFISK